MRKIIVANWKMNPNLLAEAKSLFRKVRQASQGVKNVTTVICPPFVWLPLFSKQKKSIFLGGQDVFWETQGAFTGEVSPLMLKELGCQYVIVGHSERREFLGETNEMINQKVKAALKAGLKVVLCVGEKTRIETKKSKVVSGVIEEQLQKALSGISTRLVLDILVAYEPIWAIGTGVADNPDDVLQASLLIRKVVAKLFSQEKAEKIKVLYGGSVTSKNVASFLAQPNIDGALIGTASLKPEEFSKILKIAAKS